MYTHRDTYGNLARILGRLEGKGVPCPVVVAYLNTDGVESVRLYTNELQDHSGAHSRLVEMHPAECWPVDKEVMTSKDGTWWTPANFCKYEGGLIFVWDNGGTSWTANSSTSVNFARDGRTRKPLPMRVGNSMLGMAGMFTDKSGV